MITPQIPVRWRRPLAATLVIAAVFLHGWQVWSHWENAQRVRSGNDFASYYFAVHVANEGGNPYDAEALTRAGRATGQRASEVHPYFYPPPFLLAFAWTPWMDLAPAYQLWFWLDELFTVLCGLVLWRWWRHLGAAVPVLIAAAIATLTAIPNNHIMGQVNLPVLALVLTGVWQDREDRSALGGVLVGTACMLKMSPAFFVAWWMLRRRWTAVATACATAVVLGLLSLAMVPAELQRHFYLEVLPGFGTGDYNGLRVPIDLFGNHSIPDVYNRLFPAPGWLSDTARTLSTATLVGLVALMGWIFRRAPADDWSVAAQVSAVGVSILLVPVYTYEHHLVWALPAVVLLGLAVVYRRVPRWWWVPLALAWTLWAFDLTTLKEWWLAVRHDWPLVGTLVRDLKFGALLGLFAMSAWLGASRPTR